MRPFEIKTCGVKDLDTALLLQELGSDYIGMIHHAGSPRFAMLDVIEEIVERTTDAKCVVVSVDPDPELLSKFVELGADQLQVHFRDVSKGRLQSWVDAVGEEMLWLTPKIAPGDSFPGYVYHYAKTLMMDGFSKDAFGGTGVHANWEQFRVLREKHPKHRWVLAGGLNADNLKEAWKLTGADILDFNSGLENEPGVKDAGKIKELFERVKTFDVS